MPVVSVEVRSPLPPAQVLRVITDFSERRAEARPGVDLDRLIVHESGENFAGTTTVPPVASVASVDATRPWTWNNGITHSDTSSWVS